MLPEILQRSPTFINLIWSANINSVIPESIILSDLGGGTLLGSPFTALYKASMY